MLTTILLAAIVVSSWIGFSNQTWFNKGAFQPYGVWRGQWSRLFIHGFLHADFMHLFINGYVLYSFGNFIENSFVYWKGSQTGSLLYLLLFFGGMIASVIPSLFKHKNNPNYRSIGASGAVSAIVFAAILLQPKAQLLVFFIPMPAVLFGVLYLGYEYYMFKKNARTGIAHDAHFYGGIFGFIFPGLINPQLFSLFVEQVLNW